MVDAKDKVVPVVNAGRRKLISDAAKTVAGASILSLVDPMVRAGAWAAGSDAH